MEKVIEQAAIDYATEINKSVKPDQENCIDEEQYLLDKEQYEYVFEESKMHFSEGFIFAKNFLFWVDNNFTLHSIGCYQDGGGNLYKWEDLFNKYKELKHGQII